MSGVLQWHVAVDEEAARRYGEDYERGIRRQAYSALADAMVKSSAVCEKIIHPDADTANEYDRYKMRRYYRFSIIVGDTSEAQIAVDSVAQGRKQALHALRHLLKQPNDYEGEMRGYFLRWLEKMTPEILAYASAQNEPEA